MRNNIFIAVIVVVFLLLAFYFQKSKTISSDDRLWKNYEVKKIKIDDKNYSVVLANQPEHWEQGLMHIRKPFAYDGMLFTFPSKTKQSFWNKNTLVDLRLLWLQDGEVVGEVDLPSIEKSRTIVTVSSPVEVDSVLEVIK